MKRSELNQILREAETFLAQQNFKLPPFAFWKKEDWLARSPDEYEEIRTAMLGWDITDFGSGDYGKVGLLMFTMRNGCLHDPRYPKPYGEKALIVREGQLTPYHFHWNKMEDIINRGGGNLMVQVYNSTPEEGMGDGPVAVSSDGRNYEAPAGAVIRLTPGESITIKTGQYHQFWGELGTGTVLVGEVSKPNDDTADNRFFENNGRFPDIEEDEEPLYYLFSEIPW